MKFAVVRNPTDRIVSQFKYMSVRSDLREFIGLKDRYEFEDCLEAIQKRKHVQWMPQVDFIRSASGDTIVDKIYRLEDLSSDPSPLAADIGIPIETLPRENHTDGVRKPVLKPSDFSMIVDMFRQDYEFLGYSIPTLDSARSHDPEHPGSGPAIAPWAEGERQDRRGERDAGRASDMRR